MCFCHQHPVLPGFPGTEANAAAALLEARKPGNYFALDYATPWPLFAWGPLNVGRGQYVVAMANFAVRIVHGPGWDPSRLIREQDGWDEHAASFDGLVDDGFLILGGPGRQREQTLHAIEAADEHEIRARLAEDPWAAAGLL